MYYLWHVLFFVWLCAVGALSLLFRSRQGQFTHTQGITMTKTKVVKRYKVYSVSASSAAVRMHRSSHQDAVSRGLQELGFEARQRGRAIRLNAVPAPGMYFELHFFPREERIRFVKVDTDGHVLQEIAQAECKKIPEACAHSLLFRLQSKGFKTVDKDEQEPIKLEDAAIKPLDVQWTLHCYQLPLSNGQA